ncbi:MAG: hypothetical protein M0Z94_14620 [Dehalococcoidales bacterium]|nr:hypothetical protein [Dehalococcoidales bacterium]
MDPSSFVGVPDWHSAVLAAIFTLPWLIWLGRGWLRSPRLWAAVVLGAAVFPFAIAWVQVPLQSALNTLWVSTLDQATIQRYLLALSIPSLLVASAVQEAAKAGVAILALRLFGGKTKSPRAGLALGAAAGAGLGGFEAFWVFNRMFGVGWSWAMVQLGGPLALLGFVERFFTVPFHVGSGALSGYGYVTGRFWRFWLLAVLLHTVANFAAVLLQVGALDAVTTEVWLAVVAVLTIGIAIWLRRAAPGPMQAPDQGTSTGQP